MDLEQQSIFDPLTCQELAKREAAREAAYKRYKTASKAWAIMKKKFKDNPNSVTPQEICKANDRMCQRFDEFCELLTNGGAIYNND